MPFLSLPFNEDWRFLQEFQDAMTGPDWDDSSWRILSLPHDWSIEHAFSPDAPGYCRAAYLPNGRGCYRKRFRIPEELRDCRTSIVFEGVYKNAELFLNGRRVGGRPWGYIPFEFEIDEFLKKDAENLFAVKVDNSLLPGTRWYSGTGIYRKVYLKFEHDLQFEANGFQIKTPQIRPSGTPVLLRYGLRNRSARRRDCETVHTIIDPFGRECAVNSKTHRIGAGLDIFLEDELILAAPSLWSIEKPSLYTMRSELFDENGVLLSTEHTRFGVRQIEFDPTRGLFLNGAAIKLHGVCLHNDGGALGAACGKQTFLRQLQILKTMGCNAVRTAHHPFSPEFLDACDETGVLVLAESFDEWQEPIRVFPYSDGEGQSLYIHYYAELFDEWAERDLRDMILRDRNHPSIFSWSVGNEIPQMYKPSGYYIAEKLIEIVSNYDDTRPVTCAAVVHRISDRNLALFPVAGFNYPSGAMLDEFHARHPEKPVLITEHYSAQTRRPPGVYAPLNAPYDPAYSHGGARAFIREMEHIAPGANACFETAERDYVAGMFLWTGFDYLGEPTPYDYPAHSSYFGVIDTCGRPKDGYYFYRSVWRPGEALLHIASHWDYRIGDQVELMLIGNCDTAEIYVNGVLRGSSVFQRNIAFFTLAYEPGELLVKGWRGGKCVLTERRFPSGSPDAFSMEAYFKRPLRPGEIEYLSCTLLDARGNTVRNRPLEIVFEVSGAGTLLAVDNGDPMSLLPYQNNPVNRFCDAHCMALIQAREPGEILVRARILHPESVENLMTHPVCEMRLRCES